MAVATNKPDEQRQNIIERKAALVPAEIDQMLAIVIRNQAAFDAILPLLKVKTLRGYSRAHGLIWRVTKKLFEDYGELPGMGTLRATVMATAEEGGATFTPEEIDTLNELVDFSYDSTQHDIRIETDPAYVTRALDLCRNFLQQRAAVELSKVLVTDGQVVADLPNVLTEYMKQISTYDALCDANVIEKPFADGWANRENVKLHTCGIGVLDKYMGGGWRGGDCVVFLGPFGSCKTLVTCAGVCGSIQYAVKAYLEARQTDPETKIPVVFLVFTEGTKDEYRMRLMSNFANIPWPRLNAMTSLADLSNATVPGASEATEYEKKDYGGTSDKPDAFRNERMRVDQSVETMNEHLVLLDCTENESAPGGGIGRGGVPQIAALISTYLQKHPNKVPFCLWLDHASALAGRMMDGSEADPSRRLQLNLKNMPRLLVDMVGKRYHIPVAIMHQLSGVANTRGTTAELSHADSADCKSFAEYATFAFVTTKPNEDRVCMFRCTKHRRSPPMPYTLVRLNGQFNSLEVAEGFTLVPGSHKIMIKSEADNHTGTVLTTEVPEKEDDVMSQLK